MEERVTEQREKGKGEKTDWRKSGVPDTTVAPGKRKRGGSIVEKGQEV